MPPPVTEETVASLLTRSRRAHQAALQRRQPQYHAAATENLVEAYVARRDAHALDPAHASPAWTDGGETGLVPRGYDAHTALMAFYEEELADVPLPMPVGRRPLTPDEVRALGANLVAVLRAILAASATCVGHADCGHSLKPWQDAQRLLDHIDGEDADA